MMFSYTRHALRRMRWRKISREEVENTIQFPDNLEPSLKNRLNAYKAIGGRLLKVTYSRKDDLISVVTVVWKGE